MRSIFKYLTFFLSFIVVSQTMAQTSGTKVTYLEKRPVSKEVIDKIPEALRAQVLPQIEKKYTKTKMLQISGNESTYQEVEALENTGNANITIVTSGSGSGTNVIYKNTESGTLMQQKMIEDKKFVIKDKLSKPEWTMGDQKKQMGQYTVRNATTNSNGETITAWYTTDIPVNNGPGEYWGLPGLILSVEYPNGTKVVCQEITLKSEVTVEQPKKGKSVSQAEFDKMQAQYVESIKSQYGAGSGTTVIRN